MGNMFNRGRAVIGILAISIALAAGIGFGMVKDVKAADGELVVNQETAVSAAEDESVTYTFTAPEDGTYYFTTVGNCYTIGELYIDEKLCKADDWCSGEGCNFLITYYLKKDQKCSISVRAGHIIGKVTSLNSNLVVYDYNHASKIVKGFVSADGKETYVCNVGDSITLSVVPVNLAGEKMDTELYEYSFKWCKKVCSLESIVQETIFYSVKGHSYTIDKITADDFRDGYDGCETSYDVCIYKDGKIEDYIYFTIFNKNNNTTDNEQTPTSVKKKGPGQVKIKKIASKKKSSKKVKLTIKKVNTAKGYQVAVYTTKKNAKNNKKAIVKKNVNKAAITVSSPKLKNRKTLYVKVRAYALDGKTKIYGKWSKLKKITINK